MELLQLRYFCSVAKLENVSKAAQLHRIPQSAMSKTISRLEAELGTPLFDRTPNSLSLNDAGFQFYWEVKEALKIINKAEYRARVTPQQERTRLKIYLDSCSDYFNPLISSYSRDKGLFADVSSDKNAIRQGKRFDFYLCNSPANVTQCDYEERLYNMSLLLAVSKKNPLAKANHISLKQIPTAQYVLYRESNVHEQVRQALLRQNLNWDLVALGDRLGDVISYVEDNQAFSFIPGIYEKTKALKQIKLLPVISSLGDFQLCLTGNKSKCSQEPALENFWNYLVSIIEQGRTPKGQPKGKGKLE